MMEPEIVKNRGLGRVSGGIVVDDWAHTWPKGALDRSRGGLHFFLRELALGRSSLASK